MTDDTSPKRPDQRCAACGYESPYHWQECRKCGMEFSNMEEQPPKRPEEMTFLDELLAWWDTGSNWTHDHTTALVRCIRDTYPNPDLVARPGENLGEMREAKRKWDARETGNVVPDDDPPGLGEYLVLREKAARLDRLEKDGRVLPEGWSVLQTEPKLMLNKPCSYRFPLEERAPTIGDICPAPSDEPTIEQRVAGLERADRERVNLVKVAECSGCAALEQRVAELARREKNTAERVDNWTSEITDLRATLGSLQATFNRVAELERRVECLRTNEDTIAENVKALGSALDRVAVVCGDRAGLYRITRAIRGEA